MKLLTAKFVGFSGELVGGSSFSVEVSLLVVLQIRQLVFLLCHRGPGQRADHAGDHPQIRGAAG